MSLPPKKIDIPHLPIPWASAYVPVCSRHPECWVIPGGEHTGNRSRAMHCAREMADLIGPDIPKSSQRSA